MDEQYIIISDDIKDEQYMTISDNDEDNDQEDTDGEEYEIDAYTGGTDIMKLSFGGRHMTEVHP